MTFHFGDARIEPVYWSRVVEDDGCWMHNAAPGARYAFAGSQGLAHRYFYKMLVGEIPEGLTLDHLCREKRCVNPSHLEPVSRGENVRRYAATKTHCPKGHEYTDENTYLTPEGWRQCRTCRRDIFHTPRQRANAARRQREYKARLRAKQATAAEQVVSRLDSYSQEEHLEGIEQARKRTESRRGERRAKAQAAAERLRERT